MSSEHALVTRIIAMFCLTFTTAHLFIQIPMTSTSRDFTPRVGIESFDSSVRKSVRKSVRIPLSLISTEKCSDDFFVAFH